MTLNENAAIVLAALGRCALPHQFAIAGGYARDLFFGVMPKDIDVVVIGYVDATQIVQAFKEHGYALTADNSTYDDAEHFIWERVLQFSCPDKLDVDILLAPHPDVLAAVNAFDCNLNQFIVHNAEPKYLGGGNAVLHWHREPTPARREYIESKARALGWVVPINPEKE